MFDRIWNQLFLTLISKKKKRKEKKIQKIWGCPEFQFYQKNVTYGSCENLPSKTILRRLILGNNGTGLKSPLKKPSEGLQLNDMNWHHTVYLKRPHFSSWSISLLFTSFSEKFYWPTIGRPLTKQKFLSRDLSQLFLNTWTQDQTFKQSGKQIF